MKKLNTHQFAFGVLFLRWLLGIILLMQGYGKIFEFGVDQVYNHFFLPYSETTFLGEHILLIIAYFTSYAEFLAGIFLLLGIGRMFFYLLICIVLIIVSYGHGLVEPIWNLNYVFFRAVMVFALLIIPLSKDTFALDKQLYKFINK